MSAAMSEELICTAGIAALLGCTREHVTDRLIKKAGFPRPKIELSQKMRRWDRDEVMHYLTQKPRRAGRPRSS